jgi:periplasmic protein TonB
MRSWLPRDRSRRVRTRRAFVIAGACSVLFHLLLAATILVGGVWSRPQHAKKGEPLFVDIAPDKPEEKAPLGNPSRPPSPVPAREAPRPPAPKAPEAKVRVAEAPRPAPPAAPPAPVAAPAPPAPAPPEQVAKVAPEPSAPKSPEPAPAPTPQAAPPPREMPGGPAESVTPPSPPTPPSPLTARSSGGIDLPAAMLRRPPSAGGGLQGGRGGVEGEPIPLDTPDPKYQDYFRILRERIQSKWTYPREAGDRGIGGALLIEFHIAKDGRLAYLEVRRSSGVEILDEYAVNAVKLAQPFPPVPDNLAKQVLAVNGNFVYHIVENSLVKQFTR